MVAASDLGPVPFDIVAALRLSTVFLPAANSVRTEFDDTSRSRHCPNAGGAVSGIGIRAAAVGTVFVPAANSDRTEFNHTYSVGTGFVSVPNSVRTESRDKYLPYPTVPLPVVGN